MFMGVIPVLVLGEVAAWACALDVMVVYKMKPVH
jgi:hypothetical protein